MGWYSTLLRNALWRKLIPKGSPPGPLSRGSSTSSPATPSSTPAVTFCSASSRSRAARTPTRTTLERLTENGPVGLGQHHPIAAATYRVTRGESGPTEELLERFALLDAISAYRVKYTRMEPTFQQQAVQRLTPEPQSEIARANEATEASTRAALVAHGRGRPALVQDEHQHQHQHDLHLGRPPCFRAKARRGRVLGHRQSRQDKY